MPKAEGDSWETGPGQIRLNEASPHRHLRVARVARFIRRWLDSPPTTPHLISGSATVVASWHPSCLPACPAPSAFLLSGPSIRIRSAVCIPLPSFPSSPRPYPVSDQNPSTAHHRRARAVLVVPTGQPALSYVRGAACREDHLAPPDFRTLFPIHPPYTNEKSYLTYTIQHFSYAATTRQSGVHSPARLTALPCPHLPACLPPSGI